MPNYNAPVLGGTVRGSGVADILNGSAFADVLWGLGGNDQIFGGDGNDILEGDGVSTLADAFRLFGFAQSSLSAPVAGPGGVQMTAMGSTGTQSVWMLRNTSDAPMTVVLRSASNGNNATSITLTLPPKTETLVPSDNGQTHKLVVNGATVATVPASNAKFDASAPFSLGPDGDDYLDGGAGNDTLRGYGGNDVLIGGAGADAMDGGTGTDTVSYATAGSGVVLSFSATDQYGIGSSYANRAAGGYVGDAAGDTFANFEVFVGSKYADLVGGSSSVAMTYWLGDGNDVFDTVYTAVINDEVHGENGNDTMWGGNGADRLFGDAGDDVLYGETGNDVLDGGSGNDLLSGDEGDDTLNGGDGNDTLNGGTGNDLLNGGSGNDALDGGDGNDTLSGGDGNDTLNGGAGNDTLSGGSGNDTLNGGTGDDLLVGGAGGDTLAGGDGVDTVDYSASQAGVTVNLLTGVASGGDADGDKLSGIENLVGSAFADVLTGDAGANKISAGAGNDVVFGSSGGDTLDGGADIDTVNYSNSNAGVNVNLLTGVGSGGFAQGDKLSNFENLVGSAFADVLTGDAAANSISAGAGNDVVFGSSGGDTLDGGADTDTADYSNSNASVNVNLLTGVGSGGFAQGDKLSNFENLVGSAFADVLTGDAAANVLNGGAGDDLLAGGAGTDTLIGGDGNDTADYSTSLAAVNVNLATSVLSGGDASGDVLVSIENVTGSGLADILTGNAGVNVLNGGAGDDLLVGGAGADTLIGGDGVDTADYSASLGAVTVDLLAGTGLGGDAEGDKLSGIENLVGTAGNDVLGGNDDSNIISGGLGDDLLNGAGGNDQLYGEDGNDRINAGDGDDLLVGGLGNDALFGDAGNDTLIGGIGNDRLTGGAGADVLNGGDGTDMADYRWSSGAVNVSLMTGTGTGGDAEGDTLLSIEQLGGSAFDDVLTGDNNANRMNGMSGADKLYGMGGNDWIITGGGYDFVDGGDGIDTVSYEDSWDRVVVNLTTGVNQYGSASRDVLVNIENVMGSEFNDSITGDAGVNRLNGGLGDDMINGGGGNDYILGGGGNDTMTGGAGADVFVFEAVAGQSVGNDTITDFWAGAGRTDRLWFDTNGQIDPASVSYTAVDTATGALITVAGFGSVTLTGVKVAQLNADDFIFT